MATVNKELKKTNFVLYQGSVFEFLFVLEDINGNTVDTTLYVFEMHIKKEYSDASALIELTEGNGRVTHQDDSNGLILFRLTAAETAALDIDVSNSNTTPPSERWVYDMEAHPGTGVQDNVKFLVGEIKAIAEVTI